MRYRAPVPADAPAVLAVFEARDIADLGEAEQTVEELRDEWRNSDLDLERCNRAGPAHAGRLSPGAQPLADGVFTPACSRGPGSSGRISAAFDRPGAGCGALHGVDTASFAPAPDYTPESLTEFTAGLREVRLGVASYNPRALHVYERLGMTERFRFDVYERPAGPSRRSG